MHLELCSGVKVSIQENGKSKFLVFDRPVRTMELSIEESKKLASSLMKNHGTGITDALRSLIESGFFFESKSFKDIRKELSQKGAGTRTTSLNRILTKMVERGELVKAGQKGAYQYKKTPMEEKNHA